MGYGIRLPEPTSVKDEALKSYIHQLLRVLHVNFDILSSGGTGSITDTDDLSEGSTNLYFSNERVDDRVNALLVAGANITLTYNDPSNTLTIASSGGGGSGSSYFPGGW
jgi:hypothetical protein